MRRLNRVIDEFAPNKEIHFLKIDVEGTEESVLRGINFNKHRPWAIVVEVISFEGDDTLPSINSILTNSGYSFYYCDGLNSYYIANEHYTISHKFKYPPNVYDKFLRASEHDRITERNNTIAKKIKRVLKSAILNIKYFKKRLKEKLKVR